MLFDQFGNAFRYSLRRLSASFFLLVRNFNRCYIKHLMRCTAVPKVLLTFKRLAYLPSVVKHFFAIKTNWYWLDLFIFNINGLLAIRAPRPRPLRALGFHPLRFCRRQIFCAYKVIQLPGLRWDHGFRVRARYYLFAFSLLLRLLLLFLDWCERSPGRLV